MPFEHSVSCHITVECWSDPALSPPLSPTQASQGHRAEQQAKIEAMELRRTMKSIVVPVIDGDVRKLLRQLQEPITLFGEKEVRKESG